MSDPACLGIDASNIRGGGGISHLTQLLEVVEPREYGIERVFVWVNETTAARLPRRDWLEIVHEPALDGRPVKRAIWQQVHLARRVREKGCRLLYTPGGTFLLRKPCPTLTMSRNMLPFDRGEIGRFGLSWNGLRYRLLRRMHARSFLKADGVIFLTDYARQAVCEQLSRLPDRVAVIPHGVDERFRRTPREQRDPEAYTPETPFRLLYVSFVKLYKHQWHVCEAVARMRRSGVPVAIDFVGPAWEPAKGRLERAMDRWDPDGEFLHYRGPVPFQDLHEIYGRADAFVFASSCENMPNILLEAMASGLPVACSDRGPMPEVLGDAGVYFDPENPESIEKALRDLVGSRAKRESSAVAAYERAGAYSWKRCADQTFRFISEILAG